MTPSPINRTSSASVDAIALSRNAAGHASSFILGAFGEACARGKASRGAAAPGRGAPQAQKKSGARCARREEGGHSGAWGVPPRGPFGGPWSKFRFVSNPEGTLCFDCCKPIAQAESATWPDVIEAFMLEFDKPPSCCTHEEAPLLKTLKRKPWTVWSK